MLHLAREKEVVLVHNTPWILSLQSHRKAGSLDLVQPTLRSLHYPLRCVLKKMSFALNARQ
jgi:hypothetical protein